MLYFLENSKFYFSQQINYNDTKLLFNSSCKRIITFYLHVLVKFVCIRESHSDAILYPVSSLDDLLLLFFFITHVFSFRLSSMYIGRGSIHDVSDNNSGSTRASPRIPTLDNDCPPLKRPKIEPVDPDSEDQQRQVSQTHNSQPKSNPNLPPHIIINLEDWSRLRLQNNRFLVLLTVHVYSLLLLYLTTVQYRVLTYLTLKKWR